MNPFLTAQLLFFELLLVFFRRTFKPTALFGLRCGRLRLNIRGGMRSGFRIEFDFSRRFFCGRSRGKRIFFYVKRHLLRRSRSRPDRCKRFLLRRGHRSLDRRRMRCKFTVRWLADTSRRNSSLRRMHRAELRFVGEPYRVGLRRLRGAHPWFHMRLRNFGLFLFPKRHTALPFFLISSDFFL